MKKDVLKSIQTKEIIEKKIPCIVYSRVVGYYRPVDHYNKGKQQEWEERKLINSNFESKE